MATCSSSLNNDTSMDILTRTTLELIHIYRGVIWPAEEIGGTDDGNTVSSMLLFLCYKLPLRIIIDLYLILQGQYLKKGWRKYTGEITMLQQKDTRVDLQRDHIGVEECHLDTTREA